MKQLINNTPLVTLFNEPARTLAKLESFNLTGSSKDRAAAAMLDDACLPPGATVVEATSGNTGIALAALCAQRGCRCIIFMPEDMSWERQQLICSYGAEVALTPAEEGMAGACRRAEHWAQTHGNSFYVNQFANPSNPAAHAATTGPEIWAQTGGRVDVFIAGVGTGGTLAGTGRYLKERDPRIQCIAVTPASGEQIPGLSTGLELPLLGSALPDAWFPVTAAQAATAARWLARTHGILAGPSSGAVLYCAQTLAREPAFCGKDLVTILPDTGRNYLSTDLFD